MKLDKMMIEPVLVEAAKAGLDAAKNVVIFTHQRPDGDALGASLALWHVLQKRGLQVQVICPDAYPKDFSFLSGSDQVCIYRQEPSRVAEIVAKADLMMMIDFNRFNRVGEEMEPLLQNFQGRRLMIDHHPDPEKMCDVCISHTGLSSTCELVFHLLNEAKWLHLLDVQSAECLYLGIMTDTNSLGHNSSYPEVYHVVAELLAKGVNKQKIYDILYNSYKADTLRLHSYAISEKMELLLHGKAAVIWLTEEELNAFNYESGDTEGLVNTPLRIHTVQFSAFFRMQAGKVRVSLRSKGDFPVNKLAAELYGGGGHLNAAGGDCSLPIEEAVKAYREVLPEFVARHQV